MNTKRMIIASVLVWILGVSAYSTSYFFEIMDNAEMQANIVLAIAVIPCSIFGAWFYYKNSLKFNGFFLGILMFLVAMCLDALITVPVFIMPMGGNHVTFFTDAGFWLIAVEYILSIGLFWLLKVRKNYFTT